MASYTALMNIQVDSQQAQLGINNLNKNLTYLSRSSRLTNKSLLQMQQTFLRIENTINQATGNTAAFNGKMQQATNIIKKLRGEVSTLRSEIDKLNQKLKGTNGPLDKQRTLWERLSGALQKNQYFTSLAISAFAGFVNQRLIGGIIKITDEYTLMENKIKTVTPTVDGVARSMESVYRIAQETRQPLAIVANLYSRIGRNSKELQQNLTALVDITSTVSKAFQLGGATIEESRNAMVQFSQALASGRLQGDELRSILELAPVLATSISKSIGITTGSLRRLASEGLITTEVLIKALLEAGKDIRAEFDNFVPTVSQSAETVVNAFTRLIGSNQKFKDANETLGNQLRKFASALDEQGDLANTLGDAYLFLARNVDVLAAAFAGLAVIVGGAAIAGLFALLASVPWVGIATGIGAVAASIGGFALASASAEGETSKLIEGTESLLKVLSDTDMKALSEKNVADIQADIMGKQAGIQRLISETSLALKDINEDLKETEQYNAIEKILGSDPKFARLLAPGASLLYKDENALKQEKALKEQRLEMLRNLAKELKIEYDNIAEAEQEGALKAMLARTRALEMQKRQLKEQEKQEQLSYYASMGSGVSDRGLQDIQFANKAAQNLRKELSKLQMDSLNTAFVGMFSVDKLFGGTDPAAAVDNINNKMKEFTKITEKDAAGGIVEFFTKYLGTGGPEGEAAIKEITEKLTKEPFLAKNLRQAMISVWQAAAAEYEIYAAKRKAEEERYLNDLLKDMRYEYQEMAAENTSDRARLMAYLQDGVTLHNKEALAIHYKISLEKTLQRLQMEKEGRSEEAILAAEKELERRRVLYENALATKNAEEAINKILQNRETIFKNQSRSRAEVSVGGPESYGGATGMDGIGSSIRDANIEYQMQIDLIDRIYKKGTHLSLELKKQEATIRDQNVQRVIANQLESDLLEIERLKQNIGDTKLESDLRESGATDLEVQLKLIERRTDLELLSYDTLFETNQINSDQYTQLRNMTVEKEKYLKKLAEEQQAAADLKATYAERAVGEAVVDGAQALFSGETYTKLYDSIVSGANYLMEGINKIEWSDLGTQIGDGLKNIDWNNLGDLFKGGMGDLVGSGLFQGIASAGGASGQRALNIAQAGAAGGPYAALGAAILSNEKVQAALSKLFDAVFEFIDPFLDLLGPVVDIFTAMLKNNPIMTAVNALKPLLTNLGNMLSALASAIESLDLSKQGGTLGYIFGGGLASDLEENIGGTLEGFGQGISGFGGIASGIVEEFSRSIEEVMGSRYFQVSAQRVKSGAKDFMDVYREAYDATANELVYYTERVTKETKFMGVTVFKEYQDYVRSRAMTEAERIEKAREAVLNVLNQVLDGIEDETEALLDEAEKLNNQSMKTDLEQAIDTVKSFSTLLSSLEEARPAMSNKDYEDAKFKLEAFVEAQEKYFAAFVGSEILQATKDLEESVLSFQRMTTDPLDQASKGLGAFEKQVSDFQEAIDAVSDPVKAKELEKNLKIFTQTFKMVSSATATQEIYDINLRGYDLTPEQELTIKYEKEIMDVRNRENLTIEDKVRVINALIAARDREIEALEREEEILNLRNAQSSLSEILSTFEKTMEGIRDLIDSLFDQVRDLLFSEFNLDPAFKKMEGAAVIYGDLLEKALDSEATIEDIERLQGFVNTYLSSARDLYKSSNAFQEIFDQVLNDLNEIGITAPANLGLQAISVAEIDLEEIAETIDVSLEPLLDELNRMKNALAKQLTDFENFKLDSDIQAGLEIVDDQGNTITNLIKYIGADLVLVGSDGVTEIREVIAYANGKLELIDEQNNVVNTVEVSATGVPVLKDANGNVTGNLEFNAQGDLVIVDSSGNEIGSIRKEIAAEIAILDKNGSPVTELLPAIELGDVKIVDQYNNEIGKITKKIEGEILVVDNNDNPLRNLIAKLPGGITLTQDGRVVDTLTTTATGQVVLTNSKVGDVYLIDAGKVSAEVGLENPVAFAGKVTAYAALANTTTDAGDVTATAGLTSSTAYAGTATPVAGLTNDVAFAGKVTATAGLNNVTAHAGKVYATAGLHSNTAYAGNVTASVGLNNSTASAGKITGTVGLNTGNLTWRYLAGVGWSYTASAGNVSATVGLNNYSAHAGNVYGTATLSNPYQYVTNVGWRYVHSAGQVYISGTISPNFSTTAFNQEVQTTQNEINNKLNSFNVSSYNVTSKIQSLQNEINSAISSFSLNSVSSGGGTGSAYPTNTGGGDLMNRFYTGNTGHSFQRVSNSQGFENIYYYTGQQGESNRDASFAAAFKTKMIDEGFTYQSHPYLITYDAPNGYNYVYAFKSDKKSLAQADWNWYQTYRSSSMQYYNKYGFQKGGLVPGPMDTIPAMLAPGEYIMSQGAVDRLGVGTLNSLNAGDLSALRQTGDPEVRSLLRELIIAVKTSDTEVNVYTDMRGEAKAAIGEFRTELRERSRRQGEKYVNVRYV